MLKYPPHQGLAGIARRVGAGVYDGLLVGGLLMVSAGVLTYFLRPANAPQVLSAPPQRWMYSILALIVIALYFGIAWTRSGETLGMKAWSLRLFKSDGQRADWAIVLGRLALAIPLWLMPVAALFLFMGHKATGMQATLSALPLLLSLSAAYRGGITLHDKASNTRICRVPKDAPV